MDELLRIGDEASELLVLAEDHPLPDVPILIVGAARWPGPVPLRRRRWLSELAQRADELTRATALLALCTLGAEPDGLDTGSLDPPFETPAGDLDPLWAILLSEARSRGRLETGRSDAWAPLVRIRALASDDPSLVEYIDAKIAAGVARSGIDDPEAFARMPSAVILAAARGSAGKPESRLRALDLLRVVADRDEPSFAADALWTIGVVGRAHNTARTRALATEALAQLATRFPDHPLAGDALTGAIANAHGLDIQTQ